MHRQETFRACAKIEWLAKAAGGRILMQRSIVKRPIRRSVLEVPSSVWRCFFSIVKAIPTDNATE